MVLTYAKYIDLMTALDEYCKGELDRIELQKAIFKRYTNKYGSFVAENSIGSKKLFMIRFQRDKLNKREMKKFCNYMDAT